MINTRIEIDWTPLIQWAEAFGQELENLMANEQLRQLLDKFRDEYGDKPPHLPKVRSTAKDRKDAATRLVGSYGYGRKPPGCIDRRLPDYSKASRKTDRKR